MPKPKVVQDDGYLAFLRTCPCIMHQLGFTDCDTDSTMGMRPSEASHLDGKSRDDRALPMCGGHHRTNKVSWHNGQRSFCEHYDWPKETLIAMAEAMYEEWAG